MRGYADDTYGERIADVYDDWFGDVNDPDANARFIDTVVSTRPSRILELAVGTGRLALPLAALGHDVTGIDVSAAMLDRLRAKDSEGSVTTVLGDMVDDLPPGPFDLVFVAFNSLFMVTDPRRQAACFGAVAAVLDAAGAFVVEAFVPWEPPRDGSHVDVRAIESDRVVLDVTLTDGPAQTVTGQRILLVDGARVRMVPYALRWSTPDELDAWAEAAGLRLAERYADVDRTPFDDDAAFHVSVYRI
jgi:SAM-dependent methyltransferase